MKLHLKCFLSSESFENPNKEETPAPPPPVHNDVIKNAFSDVEATGSLNNEEDDWFDDLEETVDEKAKNQMDLIFCWPKQ